MKYKFVADNGHGWLLVSLKELKELNITDKISKWSHWTGNRDGVWIEQDCDLETFLTAKQIAYANREKWWRDNVEETFIPGMSGLRLAPSYISQQLALA